MAEMIRLYLQEIPQLVQTMKRAIEGSDWNALKMATHSIIPTFATMGIKPDAEEAAKVIQSLAAILISNDADDEASQETIIQINTLFLTIETVCAQAAQELTDKLQLLSQNLQPARI